MWPHPGGGGDPSRRTVWTTPTGFPGVRAAVAPALVYINAERTGPGEVKARRTERELVLADDDTGRSTSSMLQDRAAGRPLEHDGLTGAVVRLAERHGIDAPASRALLALTASLT